MNYIESDFKKTIDKHIKVEGDEITVNQVSLAKECAGKVARFFYWWNWGDHQFAIEGDEDGNMLIGEYVKGGFRERIRWIDLPDLYKYFIEEIDGK